MSEHPAGPNAEKARAAVFERAPEIASFVAFIAGAVTLLAVAMPKVPHFAPLKAIDHYVAEFPELSASVGAVMLMGLATGLRRRLDAAWAATVALLAVMAAYAFFRQAHLPAATAAAVATFLLLLARPAFYRHSRLTNLAPDPRVALAIAAALAVAVVAAVLWASAKPKFADTPWWALFTDPDIGQAGRTVAVAIGAFMGLFGWRYLLTHASGAPAPAAESDLARVEALIGAAENGRPDAQLAFTGDKSFLFVDGAFVMNARGGGSLIAMGGPVGKQSAWRAALIAHRQQAEQLSLRPVVCSAPPELLPDLLDCGFRVEKYGENAVVDLASFSLSGSAKQNLRTARRRFVEREHGRFDLLEPPHPPALWAELRPVSDAWLAAHGGREKAFALGRFDPAFLARQPIAVARIENKAIAFANIWSTFDRSHAALDLMRYHPESMPHGAMDFLFAEILLWAKAAGYRDFDLGMAPLAGLADDEYARLFARIGRFVYDRAEAIYGFQGLRKFKEKFGPRWEPRYIAAPGAWQLPLVLAETALLTSGGVAGLLNLPEKDTG